VSSAVPGTAPAPAVAPPYPAALSVAAGGGWRSGLAREGRIALARPAVQLGRLEGSDVVLLDPLVSRHHAVIRWTPSDYEIEDLGSANGTHVQGRRITGRTPLAPGQTIRLGNTEMRFEAYASALPASAQGGAGMDGKDGDGAQMAPHWPAAGGQNGQVAAGVVRAAPNGFYEAMAQERPRGLRGLVRTQWSKRYWRVFLAGLIAYFGVSEVLRETGNLHLVPLVMLLASALVPVVFVMFCWEQNAFADMPLGVVGITFLGGAVLGLTIAAVLEPLLLPPEASAGEITLGAALLIGVVEETAKVVPVLWFLRDRRVRSELDGLILGAAAGMGFAALETAGYGFAAFLVGFANTLNAPGANVDLALAMGTRQMNVQLLLRMALAIFGHGVWTAIVCAALWRERRGSRVRLTLGVLVAFALAVTLHALWDWSPLAALMPAGAGQAVSVVAILGWFVVIGATGLTVLGALLHEALERAKQGPDAPAPPPLVRTLASGLFGGQAR
jgi:protease PrsW